MSDFDINEITKDNVDREDEKKATKNSVDELLKNDFDINDLTEEQKKRDTKIGAGIIYNKIIKNESIEMEHTIKDYFVSHQPTEILKTIGDSDNKPENYGFVIDNSVISYENLMAQNKSQLNSILSKKGILTKPAITPIDASIIRSILTLNEGGLPVKMLVDMAGVYSKGNEKYIIQNKLKVSFKNNKLKKEKIFREGSSKFEPNINFEAIYEYDDENIHNLEKTSFWHILVAYACSFPFMKTESRHQATLLSMFDLSGSGKSEVVREILIPLIFGDYGNEETLQRTPVDLGATDAYIRNISKSSNMVFPLNEFNYSAMSKERKKGLEEMVKKSYDGSVIGKTINGGAEELDFKINATFCIIGQNEGMSEALENRTINLSLRKGLSKSKWREIVKDRETMKSINQDVYKLFLSDSWFDYNEFLLLEEEELNKYNLSSREFKKVMWLLYGAKVFCHLKKRNYQDYKKKIITEVITTAKIGTIECHEWLSALLNANFKHLEDEDKPKIITEVKSGIQYLVIRPRKLQTHAQNDLNNKGLGGVHQKHRLKELKMTGLEIIVLDGHTKMTVRGGMRLGTGWAIELNILNKYIEMEGLDELERTSTIKNKINNDLPF